MKIQKVTITGADDTTDPIHLVELSKFYPFVEWGILFSPSKQGQLRYPHPNWIDGFTTWVYEEALPVQLSAHLCGQWTRDVLNNEFSWVKRFPTISAPFKRAQLNMTDDAFGALNLKNLHETLRNCKNLQEVILQTKRKFERSEEVVAINNTWIDGSWSSTDLKFSMLYDVSGGKGKSPKSWAANIPEMNCGYAGGLGPENLEEKLNEIATFVGTGPVWIDMESRVRDEDDVFSIEKVRKVLEIAAPWVGNE